MTVEELRQDCNEQIALAGPDANVFLYYPKRKWGKTNTRRLCPGGPKGTIINDLDGGITIKFKAQEVLDFLNSQEGTDG